MTLMPNDKGACQKKKRQKTKALHKKQRLLCHPLLTCLLCAYQRVILTSLLCRAFSSVVR